MMGFGMLGSLLVPLVVLIGGIALAIGWRPDFLARYQSPGQSSKSPLEILQERYARGEISREEFESMRRDLES